ncbi:uncharacterized protein LOC135381750 [Ornithodoros turicata]|uniref:uncharacterized protein LOC135381750 n=1 Tax=Ornithodoros turicata TaxID=34597 RepID=UPI003139BF04
MNRDVRDWVRTWQSCQRSKVHRHTFTPIGKFDIPDIHFDHVHLDIVGPPPPSSGYCYLLTAGDRYSSWPEATPMADIGRQFESTLFNAFTKLLGTTRFRTTSYHPASNGLVERLHLHLKTALMAREERDHWVNHLPLVLLGIRATLKPDLGCSSAEQVYGSALRLPGFLRPSTIPARPRGVPPAPPTFLCLPSADPHPYGLLPQDAVRWALTPPYSGPHTILSRGEKTFRIFIRGKPETVSADRIKPAFVECPTIAASSASEDDSDDPPRNLHPRRQPPHSLRLPPLLNGCTGRTALVCL